MELTGQMIVGSRRVTGTGASFYGSNPATDEQLSPAYSSAVSADVNEACELAEQAFHSFRQTTPEQRAAFLEQIATNIEALGDALIERAMAETGLPQARLQGERGRTMGQLRAFAEIVRTGLWQEPALDTAQPDRAPLPKPDLRMGYVPLGPVAVFGASNFPLAFSTAGGDTASALAAGAPVIVKGHPAHPGTAELVGLAIQKAVAQCELHAGVFSLLFCDGITTGTELVKHPVIKAVGFTGSQAGGTALMNIAANRPEPIPVYAEMSSINPVFLLPGALQASGQQIAEGFSGSLVMGAGQFCTNPGMVVALESPELEQFINTSAALLAESASQTMLTAGIYNAYQEGVSRLLDNSRVQTHLAPVACNLPNQCAPALASVSAEDFLASSELQGEIFGSVSLVVRCQSEDEMRAVAGSLEGQLTTTVHCTPADNELTRSLLPTLELKAGRILFNGYPTGVEVSHAMVHGGPFPSTSDSRTTSVGSSAIKRFLRPVSYQNMPADLLPETLKDENSLAVNRIIDGKMTL
ncbi:aldehyde dehydrogenase (NADP(+)) [Parendozoicomonas haliclonae]|uniref:NADP-dependent fatty aldehyde dehydrogenase n=1 Tax=Parendozoicomonas haliclonae TaxID=1960125 RepID=A0A1X7AKS7_9GAMM|nr:aldehyde dehydrogenase (NADP(+)) [Parendozoicomonas haliclonae]SMA44314.1 NADP-dependent fatty aldehyde dehydrogenase [Parendozoicomonas haliclonae]